SCPRGDLALEPGKERIPGNGIPGCTMKPTCPAIPEISTGTPKTSISSVHLLRPCLEERIPTPNSCFHRDYPLPLPVSGACNLVFRQLKNCPVSFSAVPCRRRAPTLAIVPLTLTVALQSICVWLPSRAVSCISPDISTALPGAFPRPFTTIRSGSCISGRVTSKVNLALTGPIPTATTAFQCSSPNTSRL